jgi:5-methylcytosine-specific restriction protein B
MTAIDSPLDARVEQSLRECYESLLKRQELLTKERLRECYTLFRDRFGPERLQSLDGETLLNTMHAHGSHDSLVYWLEFKSDEEFPTRKFGSIAGGSALKFGLYKSQESGEWMTGNPKNQITSSVPDAVAMARKHRQQLVAAVAVLQALPPEADDQAYATLQAGLEQAAPDVSRLSWGHKYLSLLFPEKLDDYHNEAFHRHNLLKLLQLPPEASGLYVAAGRFVRLAAQMGWPMNYLTAALNERNGTPIKYWRIGTKLRGEANDQDIWPEMKAGDYAAVGWALLGDLSKVIEADDAKTQLVPLIGQHYGSDPKVASRKAGELKNFALGMAQNDVVLAADGERILGVGRVKGPYRYDPSAPADAPHRRDVEWVSTAVWQLPVSEGLRTTVWCLRKDPRNLLAAEQHLQNPTPLEVIAPAQKPIRRSVRLKDGIPARVQAILERKGQAILYGPPGTGKTYWARQVAEDLAAAAAFGLCFADLTDEEKAVVSGTETAAGLVRICTFHPAYGYEDFIEGYRPKQSTGGQLVFEQRDGIFKRLCQDAAASPDRHFILLIDEINRGDIPRIFGELLTLLEKDKRRVVHLSLPVSGSRFSVPENVFIIGTMNTADRSIALLDTALRRRFGFVELMPDSNLLEGPKLADSVPLGGWLDALNGRIRLHLGKDARNLQIGQAFLLEGGKPVTDFAKFTRILAEDIVPLLEEYCYEDYGALTQILGKDLVDEGRQRVREELFAPGRQQNLIQALLAPTPELVTSREAVAQPSTSEEPDEDSDEPNK